MSSAPSSSSAVDLVTLTFHDDGVIAEIRLNRPDRRNALSQPMLDRLLERVQEVAANPGVRAVVLSAEGKAFCAGMDLKAVRSEPARMGDLLMVISQVLRAIRRAPQPFVAAVQGAAIGGGCGLMCICDFAFTHLDAKLGYPEVSLGICPAVVAPWLIRKIGVGRARQLLLAGGTMNGEAGFEYGLATHLVDLDDLHAAALTYARELARCGPLAMATTKRWLNELDGSLDDAILDRSAALSAEVVQGEEAQQRLARIFDRE